MQKRSHTVEPPFGVLKQHKNVDKISVTIKNVKSKIILIATAYDLKVI